MLVNALTTSAAKPRSTGKNEKYSDPRLFHSGSQIDTFWWRTPQNCVQTQRDGVHTPWTA